METVLIYIALNVALFGSLYALGKTIEVAVWHLIENYDDIIERFSK
jgi:hypothetical protein